MDAFGSEHLSQQWECSSVNGLTDVAQKDTEGAELAGKICGIYIITCLHNYLSDCNYILISCGYCCASMIANKSIKA